MPSEMLQTLPGYDPDAQKNRAEARQIIYEATFYLKQPQPESTPPAMIADFEAQCVLGDDRLWRIQSHVLRPIFVGRDRPFSVSVDPERLGARSR